MIRWNVFESFRFLFFSEWFGLNIFSTGKVIWRQRAFPTFLSKWKISKSIVFEANDVFYKQMIWSEINNVVNNGSRRFLGHVKGFRLYDVTMTSYVPLVKSFVWWNISFLRRNTHRLTAIINLPTNCYK